MSIAYPETRALDHVDVYHGVSVPDPYRWLETDVRESPDVRDWVERENAVTRKYLDAIPARTAIEQRLTRLWDFARYGVPQKEAGRYFYSYNDGLMNQDQVLLQDALDAEPRLLFDPNTWSKDGTVALAGYWPDPAGRYVAYLIQDGGSDWRTAKVRDVSTGEDLADRLEWLKFTAVSWAKDGSGFYYSRYPAPEQGAQFQSLNKNQAVYFHRIGTPQTNDRLVYSRPDHPEWGFDATVTDDGRWLVITMWVGTDSRYQIAYQDLRDAQAEPVLLVEGFENDYTLAGSDGSRLIFRTNLDAPRGRLIAIDVTKPDRNEWQELVPEGRDLLESAERIGDRLVTAYLEDAHSRVEIFDLEGKRAATVELPGIGTATGFAGNDDDPETFFGYSSFNAAPAVYRYRVDTGERSVFRASKVDFDSSDYVVEQVFYASKDGTRVPMFVTHKKDIVLDGSNPTLLYGYGGFDISLTPSFSITRLAWLEMGGIYAVANIRGGGEYGEEWHKAGTKLQKQNVFDDFIAAAEYLQKTGYTRADKLAIMGGSNGGLLVGAVLNQRPDLFGAALADVGVMDMLRFNQFTAGRFWVDDYGSPQNPDEFAALYAYSPYHNIRLGICYPAVLVLTADTDDRVVPGHSFKYAARLQKAQGCDHPVLIRIETRAGHGAGTPTQKLIEEYADKWAFLAKNLLTRPLGPPR
jgi:prolyl oligopeptidase